MWSPEKGITQSLISKFLQCPYSFYWYAIRGLEEPVTPPYSLVWGDVFHVGLEYYLRTQDIELASEKMESRFYDHNFPEPMIVHSTKRMLPLYKLPPQEIETEVEFSRELTLPSGRRITVRGKADGVYQTKLFEHKCKKFIDPLQTMKEIPFDLQVNLYCYILGLNRVQYDLIRIPDEQFTLPRKLKDENLKDYCTRFYLHYAGDLYPIKSKSTLWIYQLELELEQEGIEKVINETFIPICERMCDWYETVTSPKFNIEDPTTWGSAMYRSPIRHFDPGRTDGYKSNYWNFLVDDLDVEDLVPVHLFSELKE